MIKFILGAFIASVTILATAPMVTATSVITSSIAPYLYGTALLIVIVTAAFALGSAITSLFSKDPIHA